MAIMILVSAIGYIAMFVIGAFMPSANASLKCWLFTAGYMLANFGQYSFYLIMMISILNTVEYNELKHGERDEAIIASLRPFLTKLSSALVAVLTYVFYIVFGVLNYTNEISKFEQLTSMGEMTEAQKLGNIAGVITNVQSGQKLGLLVCITVVPFIFMFVSYILYKKHYKLDEDEYTRICGELQARRG